MRRRAAWLGGRRAASASARPRARFVPRGRPAMRSEVVMPSGERGAAPPEAARRRVYALVGVPPEIQAYAMAKYSRSGQSMLESVREISAQRAEQFLNTFYFQ